ncbi:lmo0937 family membrane protein [Marinospirillum alkaliphilum]|uniref:Lmo0937 family membrane protein n=1 Tax=Marinospirillum alkaliphilum DSM 21637 TaxID=1122209 RepID=A0A1K1XFF5_9GAMM|nr:lmo0937 family membrane protein [Marinospirillum alkaliphilum]SFX47813.1 hypothetical protein SAMN02745752_01782 [Marinospirillum alkaliphilum DSM 21637]
MLEIVIFVLLALWILGFLSSHTLGGFIYVLMIIAALLIMVRLVQGRIL